MSPSPWVITGGDRKGVDPCAARGHGHAQAILCGFGYLRRRQGGDEGKRLNNNEDEIGPFFEGLDSEARVVLEAGGDWNWMCDLLDGMGLKSRLCHPLKTKATAQAGIKTDKMDSSILAHLLRMDFVPEACKPDTETRHLRELLRFRASMVKVRTSAKNKVRAAGPPKHRQPLLRPLRQEGDGLP